MLPRKKYHPQDHLSIGVSLNHSHALTCGDLIFIGGQADIDANARVTCPDDLEQQVRIAMQDVIKTLEGIGADTRDLVKLTAFYIAEHETSENTVLDIIASHLGETGIPGPAVTLVPIETHCFDGLMFEIEGIAMRGQNGERLPRSAAWIADGARLPAAFSQSVRCGQMIFTSGQCALDGSGAILAEGNLAGQSRIVLDKLQRLLNCHGADLHDAVKANVFNVEPGEQETWKEAALVRASYYREPGPAATGLSLRRLERDGLMVRYDVIAMRGEDGARLHRETAWPSGHWDWPVHLPYRHGLKVGDLVFLGGQVSLTQEGAVIDPGNMQAQTVTAMENIEKVLAELGLGLENIVKINTFYVGTQGEKDLQENASVRSRYYRGPGPASTGIPFPYLAYEDMLIEIDCVAMV
jgi:enamine deaminase RidA (YjgF/YER057c/UK114 family)